MRKLTIVFIFLLFFSGPVFSQITLFDNQNSTLSLTPYLRTDIITLNNNLDLDSNNNDDKTTYFGLDYSLAFNYSLKDSDAVIFLKLERNGPYDYDAPVFVHNTLSTSSGKVERYHERELAPDIEEYWLDLPLLKAGLRAKAGLFTYVVGHNVASNGAYENYGISLYDDSKDIKWRLYYCRPDLVNKSRLGPRIKQDQDQGIDYEHARANFFAADANFSSGGHNFAIYLSLLKDKTRDKRSSVFFTPVHSDTLGTVGLSADLVFDKLSLGLETARNFGEARSDDPALKDIEHAGYVLFTSANYDLERVKPHGKFIFASGNKVTTDMVDAGDTALTGGRNKAFSVYSPLNSTLADSIYPGGEGFPFVAMGGGWGLNYGINRPTTFADARLLDNLILTGLGFDYDLTEKITFIFDWWHLRTVERGIGIFEGVSKELSNSLGNEADISLIYGLNKTTSLSLFAGCFFPGKFYSEERDASDSSLFSPLIRGDGKAGKAYQVEVCLEFKF